MEHPHHPYTYISICIIYVYIAQQIKYQLRMKAESRINPSNIYMSRIEICKTQAQHKSAIRQNPGQCGVCCGPITQYTRTIFTCNHNQICTDCQNQYVENSLNQQNLPKCLTDGCPGTVKHEDAVAMNMLAVSLRDKLVKRIRNKELKNNKKCPTADCPGFINRGTCNLCLVIYCEQCYSPEHLGECNIYKEQLPPGIVRCPNCGQGIERDGGCLHMKCARSSCEYEFCFFCLDKWSLRHHTCGGGSSILDAIQNFFRELVA